MPQRQDFTLFVSSPADVEAERRRVARVVERLNGEFREALRLKAIRWEESFYSAGSSFQQQIAEAAESDLVIGILWSRLGSPLPPEAPPRPDGRPYESGTAYELETALAAQRAKGRPEVYVFRKTAEVRFSSDETRLEEERRQYRALRTFWETWFQTPEGHFTAGFQSFATTDEFERALEGCLRQWLARKGFAGAGPVWDPRVEGSPFRGLEPFDARHERVFFGRRLAVERCRERLEEAAARGTPFLLVVGASGAGKSSLVRAGLVPRLTLPGVVAGVDLWRKALLRPGVAPLAALAQALFEAEALPELAEGDFATPEELAGLAQAKPAALLSPLRRALERAAAPLRRGEAFERPVTARLLLVVDQFEEIFAAPEAERAAFLRLLGALVESGLVWAVATLRADRYQALLQEPAAQALKEAGATYDLPLPGASELDEILRGPLRAAGLSFGRRRPQGPDLGEELRAELSGADALPLLQMTLGELFEARDPESGTLTVEAYDRLGGLQGAIASRAEAVWASLPEAARAEFPALLKALVAGFGDEGGVLTRPVPRAAFVTSPARAELVDRLTDERLLIAEADRLRVAHEALLRHWARAQSLLADAEEAIRLGERLAPLAADWSARHAAGASDAERYLLGAGPLLAAASNLQAELPANLQAFVTASAAAEKRAGRARLRRLYAVIGGLAILTAAAVGAGFYARQQQQAAEENLSVAMESADGLIFDLAQGLRSVSGISAETVDKVLGRARSLIERLASGRPDDLRLLRSRAVMLFEFVATYLAVGDLARAEAAAGEALALAERLAALAPEETERRRDLAIAHQWVGDVRIAQGDLAGALESFQASLAIREALAAADPDDLTWQRDLAVAQERLGTVKLARGDLEGALAAQQAALATMQRLAAAESEDPDRQRDLGLAHVRIGEVLEAQGDLEGALAAHSEALEIRRRLVEQDPDNTLWQADLGLSHERVGDILLVQGDLAGALAAYEASFAISQRLAALDPGNRRWQRDLFVSYSKLGDARRLAGDLAGALRAYEAGLAVIERLVALDPQNAAWQRDLAVALERLGDLRQAQGDLAGAAKAYRQSLAIAERLAAGDPDNSEWQRGLAVSLFKVGGVQLMQGNAVVALQFFQRAQAIVEALLEREPDHPQWNQDAEMMRQAIELAEQMLKAG